MERQKMKMVVVYNVNSQRLCEKNRFQLTAKPNLVGGKK